MLMMVFCDREGCVYDVWITFGSVHEVRAFRERKKRSLWFRGLVENCVVYVKRLQKDPVRRIVKLTSANPAYLEIELKEEHLHSQPSI